MSNLKQHVDNLFRGYRETAQVKDMKEEILGNLEAKAADLIAQGWDEENARRHAAASLTSLDGLMDDHVRIAARPFLLDLAQWTLIYLLVAWIVSIPARAVGAGMLAQAILIISLLSVACGYLILRFQSSSRPGREYSVHTSKLTRSVRLVWILWGIFLLVSWLYMTGLHFASNLWFGRPVSINGPYEFAVIFFHYVLPVLSIVIPLIARTAVRLLPRHERGSVE